MRWLAHPFIRLPVLVVIYLGYGNFKPLEPQALRAVAKSETRKALPAPVPSPSPSGDCMSSASTRKQRKLLDTEDETCLVPKRPRSEPPKESH